MKAEDRKSRIRLMQIFKTACVSTTIKRSLNIRKRLGK
jgi:hypothetical protein